MKIIYSRRDDKPEFPKGGWCDEDDMRVYTEREYQLFIMRIFSMGHLCGYIEVPGVLNEMIGQKVFDVHGGITFSAKSEDYSERHPMSTFLRKDHIVLGFDCAHAGDLIPQLWPSASGEYRNMAYVLAELVNLMNQIDKEREQFYADKCDSRKN